MTSKVRLNFHDTSRLSAVTKKPKGIPMYMVRHNVFWIGDDVWWHKNEMYVSLGTLYLFVVMKILNTQTVLCSMMQRMQSACGCILLLYKLH